MAAAFRPPKQALLHALRSLVYPGVGGSGSPCCRCPVGAKRYLLTDNIMKLKEFQHKKVAIAHSLPGTKETYLRKLEEKLTQNKLILKEELRTVLHLCESRDDVELVKNVIYRCIGSIDRDEKPRCEVQQRYLCPCFCNLLQTE
ncbi:pentatricopeptide repeat domain 2 [Rhinolophus ferrumequinum]|uniref:Pentatricopeptide repeat domain 2 n=1 Tax=Rhinolophus ferrumequinum TaxID=59479 RepID=A0A7J7Y6A6_RHIFE|nr:pentatricopeptide repeat domain 2 [Rhinolophus ferrumequinum]